MKALWTLPVFLLAASVAQAVVPVPPGIGVFTVDLDSDPNHRIRVHYVRPSTWTASDRIVFVMHGVNRNASASRDDWIDLAMQQHLLVLAPEFTRQAFPGANGYSLAGMRDPGGALTPQETWLFGAVDRIFEQAREATRASRDTFLLFGHSAGAQFVHRFVLFHPTRHLQLAICANAGWYTLPVFDQGFPYGLGGTPVGKAELASALARPMIILLGERDTDTHHPELRHDADTDRQGMYRLARGQFFFDTGKRMAGQLGANFRWTLATVPGVAHDGRRMSLAAGRLLASVP